MFKKKGLEPLIATILLIVVAVILVTIVLAWGKNFSTEGLNKTNDVLSDDCSAATINVSNCDYNAAAGTNGTISFLLKNTSSTYSFVADDFTANYIDDVNSLNSEMSSVFTTTPGAITPGATVIVADTGVNITDTTRVKMQVRSKTCPGIAFTEVTCS
ncbi:MAG TPA: hypothetical protein PK685_00725 [archaeon]|nr:hypothetical protein [archaeon]